MKPLIAAVCLVSLSLSLIAHPGAGIVVDDEGRIFFTAGPMVVMIETNGAARTIVHDKKNERFYQLHHIQRTPGGWVTASDRGDALWQFTSEGKLTRFYPPPNDYRSLRVGLGGDPFALDREGNVYAVNSAQNRFTQILKVTPQGRLFTLAGGSWGYADGKGAEARFANLHSSSMLVLSNGDLLVTDDGKHVRSVAPDGTVSTLATGFHGARGLAVDAQDSILVAEYGETGRAGGRIRRIAPDGTMTTFAGFERRRPVDGPLLEASFAGPSGVAVAPNGDVFVLEPDGPRVRKISNGQVTTVLKGLP